MQVKELTLEKRVRIISNGDLPAEYKNKIFVLNPEDDTEFIDWLNGSIALGFMKNIADNSVVVEKLADAYSFKGWNKISANSVDYVKTMLIERIYTQRGELVYPQEQTNNIGCPPLYKKRQREVDLILKNIISETPGVIGIKEFVSTVVGRAYTAETAIVCEVGEMLWQTIAI